MKKLGFALSSLALLATPVFAVDQNNTGAGLGTMIFQGQDGLVSQVLAVTTNGTFGNQTFGITSGTLGATRPTSIVSAEKAREFIAGNMDELALEMAMGRGEKVDALAELMGVEDKASFGVTLQTNFSEIFVSESVTSEVVYSKIATII